MLQGLLSWKPEWLVLCGTQSGWLCQPQPLHPQGGGGGREGAPFSNPGVPGLNCLSQTKQIWHTYFPQNYPPLKIAPGSPLGQFREGEGDTTQSLGHSWNRGKVSPWLSWDKGRLQGDEGGGWGGIEAAPTDPLHLSAFNSSFSGQMAQQVPLRRHLRSLFPFVYRLNSFRSKTAPSSPSRQAGELHYLYWKWARLRGDFFLVPDKRKSGHCHASLVSAVGFVQPGHPRAQEERQVRHRLCPPSPSLTPSLR